MIEYKIVLLGSGGVGKSALTVQYISEVFVERYDPTIEDSYRKQVEIDGNQYLLEILDTAGTEQFTAMRDMYMRNGHGFILVYSIIQQDSFNEIKDIYTRICNVKEEDGVPMVLVGNKADLDEHRAVSKQSGQSLAKSFQNAIFLEASAKTRQNVSEIFTSLVRQINLKNPDFRQKKPKRCMIL